MVQFCYFLEPNCKTCLLCIISHWLGRTGRCQMS